MKNFYAIDIRTLPDPKDKPSALEDIPEKRQKKCLRLMNAEDRKRSLGAGIIINNILKDFNCKNAVREGVNGKPEADGVFFNISHSGKYVVGVASDVPVGCDIEKIDVAPLNVAEKHFCSSEIEYIMFAKDRDLAFWQMWTLKESYMKMTGEGFKLPLDSFFIAMGDTIEVYRDNVKQNCTFSQFTHDGYMISICKQKNGVAYAECS